MKTYGGFYISRIHQLSGRVFERILKESGVDSFNGAQGRILYVLWEHDRLLISEIGKYTSLAKTTLTGMLDRMEEAGLVERMPDADDRRQTFVAITEKAKKCREIYDRVSGSMNAIFYNGFEADEIKQFEKTLERIIRNLEAQMK